MTTNKTAYQIGRETELELIDDAICDLHMDAYEYAEGARLLFLRERLDRIIDQIRAYREAEL